MEEKDITSRGELFFERDIQSTGGDFFSSERDLGRGLLITVRDLRAEEEVFQVWLLCFSPYFFLFFFIFLFYFSYLPRFILCDFFSVC